MPQIDVRYLTPDETQAVLARYEALVEAMVASNNALISKLAALEDTTTAQVTVLNDWSAFTKCLHTEHALEVEKVTSTIN